MFQIKVIQKNTNTFCVQRRFPENRAIYEIMWKACVELERPRWKYNTVHAHCMLDTWGYKHIIRVC